MGLFGSILKGVKKVAGFAAKTGLSKLTGGASDIVLKKLKGTGQVKAVLAKTGIPPTEQDKALVNKLFPDRVNPSVKQTERVLDVAGYQAGVPGYSKPKKVGKGGRVGKSSRLTEPPEWDRSYSGNGTGKKPKKKKLKGTGKSTPQAQKMKALAAQWRGLGGQAGTGQTFFAWKAGR